ncbi:MAG: trypsin-like peptidase domain-containing protein, partial [Planctomycetota bacterium]
VPEGWYVHRLPRNDKLEWYITPQKELIRHVDFISGLHAICQMVDPKWGGARSDIDKLLDHVKRTTESFLRLNKKYKLNLAPGEAGRARADWLGGYAVVRRDVTFESRGKPGYARGVEANIGNAYFFLEFAAPRAEYAKLSPTLDRVMATMRLMPHRVRQARLPKPLTAEQIERRYPDSVVQIRVRDVTGSGGRGTGFFIREDGYVLTNYHVVFGPPLFDDRTQQVVLPHTLPAKQPASIEIIWPETGRGRRVRPNLKAELVGFEYKFMPGIDVALLRVTEGKGPFVPLPLTPVRSGLVKSGDAVLAVGFPAMEQRRTGALFRTEGIISNIDYINRGVFNPRGHHLNDILTSAEINPGNSGGPCIDLHTGGVIGLNTYAPTKRTEAGYKALDYAGTVAIDHALELFPQITWYSRSGRTDWRDHLELGSMLVTRGAYENASYELSKAWRDLKAAGDSRPAERSLVAYLLCLCYFRLGDPDSGNQLLEEAMRQDKKNTYALCTSAWNDASAYNRAKWEMEERGVDKEKMKRQLKPYLDPIDEKTKCMVECEPDDWGLLYWRADIYQSIGLDDLAEKDLDAALEMGADSDCDFLVMKGRLLEKKGKKDEAAGFYRKAVGIDPHHEASVLELADWHEGGGDITSALEIVRRATKGAAEPSPPLHVRHAQLLKEAGKNREACDELTEAIDLKLIADENPPRDWLSDLADVAGLCNRPDLAVKSQTISISRWPGQSSAAHAWLARHWVKKSRSGLAWSHVRAAEVMGGSAGDVNITPSALEVAD